MASANGVVNGELRQTLVVGNTSQGTDVHATLLRLTRYSAVVEVYTPGLALRTSEVFSDFKIIREEDMLYSGRAIVWSIVDAGLAVICELKLDETGWVAGHADDLLAEPYLNGKFNEFLQEWQKFYKVLPEFKVAVANLQSFLTELRIWIEQLEVSTRPESAGSHETHQRKILETLQLQAQSKLAALFERFELETGRVDKDLQVVHSTYAKRQLHPLVLCAPFMYRTYCKPLGYAGDYEMVNMMMREPFQGESLFAKLLNSFFLETPPVTAHRNRIDYLRNLLVRETDRVVRQGRRLRVLNLGCGPGLEIQAFLEESPLSSRADFTLLDFNDETIEYTRRILGQLNSRYERGARIQLVKKSVMQLLKESTKASADQFDLVYCAGLFDYLTDPVCEKLLALFYRMVVPGGFMVATNVDSCNPSRGWMEFMVDWHLCYRDSKEFAALLPKAAPGDATRIIAEPSGVNIFAEIRKPADVCTR